MRVNSKLPNFDHMSPCCDLDLEDSIANQSFFLHKSPAHDNVSPAHDNTGFGNKMFGGLEDEI